jgi:serine protease Do
MGRGGPANLAVGSEHFFNPPGGHRLEWSDANIARPGGRGVHLAASCLHFLASPGGTGAMKRFLVVAFFGACACLGGALGTSLPSHLVGPARAQAPADPPAQTPTIALPQPGTDVLALSDRFESIARKIAPAVVSIDASRPARAGQDKGREIEESGSGVLIGFPGRADTFVLTNNHVIAYAPLAKITVHLADGRILRPQKIWADAETDVALLALGGQPGSLPTAPLGDSEGARVGQWVLAIGSPFGLSQTVTHGIISARQRGQVSLGNNIRIKDFLQTDAAINPGSSGGPLVNLRGEVIGINTAIASHSGTNSGVAFSIPINLARRVAHELLEHGSVARGYLGMQLASSFEPDDALRLGLDRVQGAWVERIFADTPAAAAGLRPNDVVLQVEGVAIRDENHLINLISTLPAGQHVRLQIWRDRRPATVQAVVGDWSRAQARFRQQPQAGP